MPILAGLWSFATSKLGMYVLGAIGVAIFLAALHHSIYAKGEAAGAATVQAAWDKDKQTRIKLATDMTMLWDGQRQATEKAQQETQHERDARADDAKQQAGRLPPSIANLRFPGDSVRLLDNFISGTTPATGTTPKPVQDTTLPAPDSTVGLVTEWGVTVISMYEDCRAQVGGWINFYAALRAAQPKEQ